ncbi:MAG: sigma factor-like helix-turn-helix DNA-binding protein [Polyangia bacterium]
MPAPLAPSGKASLVGVPDEELMRRYQAGERAAFEVLFVRHAAMVQAFLFYTTFQAALSEELALKTWQAVHQQRRSFSPATPATPAARAQRFRPWLLGLAAHARREAIARAQGDHEPSPPPPIPDGATPLVRALAALPDSYREVIILHRMGTLSCAEIARVLGATEAAVKARACQGYAQLGDELAGEARAQAARGGA